MSVNKLSADYSRYLLPSQFLLILELENKVKGLSMKYKESDEPPGEPSKAFVVQGDDDQLVFNSSSLDKGSIILRINENDSPVKTYLIQKLTNPQVILSRTQR